MPHVHHPVTPRLSRDISVAQFTLVLQWPLILEPTPGTAPLQDRIATTLAQERRLLEGKGWRAVDGLSVLAERGQTGTAAADDSYGEFVYFHDFLQDVLYPAEGAGSVTILCHDGATRLSADMMMNGAPVTLDFAIVRRTVHLYETGCAMVSIELAHDGKVPLTLDRVQVALDHLRRSYPAYFDGQATARCPVAVRIEGRDVPPLSMPDRAATMAAWRAARTRDRRDVPVFDHWKALIAPLRLLADDGPWRDPSDERIPINSFIRLASDGRDAAVLSQIDESDWIRIADAEEPTCKTQLGIAWPYNSHFARATFAGAFYDRFAPDPAAPIFAVRHVFGGAHYACVGAGEFMRDKLHDQFRRHYTQMSLVARLEHASLLAVSSRLTAAVAAFKTGHRDRLRFEREVLEIQDLFLSFVHRFRFTGVSGQVQGAEMFAHWRRSLNLDTLFHEVRDELDAAIASVRAQQQDREAQKAAELNRIAFVAALIGLVLGALSVKKELAPMLGALGWTPTDKGALRDVVMVTLFVFLAGFALWTAMLPKPAFRVLGVVFAVAFLAILTGQVSRP